MDKNSWDRWVMQTAKQWDDIKFVIKETGVAPVDHDHKKLAGYILELNRILKELDEGFTLEKVEEQKRLLDKILHYTIYHFNREEELIKKFQIPGLEEQRNEHKKIIEMIEKQIFQFQTGRISSGQKLRINLLQWVVKHINETDYEIFSLANIADRIASIDDWDDLQNFIRSVHVPLIDEDHKLLTNNIIQLSRIIKKYKKSQSPEDRELIKAQLEETIETTEIHFNNEQHLIAFYRIPGKEIQEEQHRNFLEYLEEMREKLKDAEFKECRRMEKKLMIWWISHINIYDYNTFQKNNWIERVLLEGENPEMVQWLIAKTGIETIDNDHLHFVDLIYECRSLFEDDISLHFNASDEDIKKLLNYAQAHFHREEEIMHRDFPDALKEHRKEHNNLIDLLKQQRSFIQEKMIDFSPHFRKHLLRMWISHTNGTDLETFGVYYGE